MEKYSEENKMNDDNEFDDINIKTNSNSDWLSLLSQINNKIFTHTSVKDLDCNEEVLLYKNTKVKDMMKNDDNIIDIKIMYGNLSIKELDQVIHNLINWADNKYEEEKEASSSKDLKNQIVFEKLKGTTSDYMNFINRKRNDPLTTDQIHLLRTQIDLNELTIKQISSKFYVSLSVLYKIKELHQILLKEDV